MKNKGQAALEFMVTYGWALLVTFILIGTLSYYGVFNYKNFLPYSCNAGSAFGCDVSVSEDKINIRLQNELGKSVVINSVKFYNAEQNESQSICNFNGDVLLKTDSIIDLETTDRCQILKKNGKFSMNLMIEYYDPVSGQTYSKENSGFILTD
jgi:uncharacterized protein (UPF0333 family)